MMVYNIELCLPTWNINIFFRFQVGSWSGFFFQLSRIWIRGKKRRILIPDFITEALVELCFDNILATLNIFVQTKLQKIGIWIIYIFQWAGVGYWERIRIQGPLPKSTHESSED